MNGIGAMLNKYQETATRWLNDKVADWEAERGEGEETEEDGELGGGIVSMRAPSGSAAAFGPALGDTGRGVAVGV